MRTIKPLRLGIITRPYQWRGQHTLGVAVMALATLEDEPTLCPEQELWQMAAEVVGPGTVLDLGLPKPVPEVLVSGHAYTAHSAQRTHCLARWQVGPVTKSLLVFGERHWEGQRPSAPQPFDSLSLGWEHAYGGPTEPRNPLGMGAGPAPAGQPHALPHLEHPEHRLHRPGQTLEPVSFGALAPDWPQRLERLRRGTFDDAWLAQDFPGFAQDMDWTYTNAAAPDQWLHDAEALPEAMPYALWNLHPTLPVQTGRLPAWQARCFLSRTPEGRIDDEVVLSLSTAWFFPDRERVLLIWHGSAPMAEDDAADIHQILPALELAGTQPRPLSHYQEVMTRRLDRENGALYAWRDSDLVPRSVCRTDALAAALNGTRRPAWQDNLLRGAARLRAAEAEALRARGLNPDDFLPPEAAPEPEPTHEAMLEDLIDQAERDRAEAQQQRAAQTQALRDDPEVVAAAQAAGLDLDTLLDAENAPPQAADLRRQLRDLSTTAALGPDGGTEDLEALKARVLAAHAAAAHAFAAPAPLTPVRAGRLSRKVAALAAQGRDFRGQLLMGARFEGLDLRGAVFAGATLDGAQFIDCQLDEADFSNACLAHVQWQRCQARQANFTEANLGASQWQGCDLTGAKLTRAQISYLQATDCRFDATHWQDSQLLEVQFTRCRWHEANWQQIICATSTLVAVDFAGTRFDQCLWVACGGERWQLVGAHLTRSGFVQCAGALALDLRNAHLEGCSAADRTSLAGANLAGAHLRQCGLRGVAFTEANLAGAWLEDCDFSNCDLRLADLRSVRAGGTLFVRADFTGATLAGADLIQAILAKADLRGADLRGANLFQADLGAAWMDDTTLTDGAYTRWAKLLPQRRTGQVA